MKEEALARTGGDCLDDLVKGTALVWIERVDTFCPQLDLLLQII